MIYILFGFFIFKQYLQQQEICKTDVLSKYGFRGLQFAINYEDLVPYMEVNMCPNLSYSCCGQADFKYAGEQWAKNRNNLKEYIKGMYKIIQQITVLQSSLLIFKSDRLKYQNKYCRNVDFQFFYSPQNHEDIFEFIPQAFKAFGFLQKGFYCMTCDANAQQYLSVRAPTQIMENIISEKFCSQLIFFFREYLIYKTLYLDTLHEQVVELGNCLQNKEVYHYKRSYNTNFNSLQECLYKGLNCDVICRQFSIGHSGSMFLGDLHEYIELVKIIKEILQTRKGSIDKSEEEEENKLDLEFYKQLTSDFFTFDMEKGKEGQRQTRTNVRPDGLNLFEYSITSNFYLEIFSKHQYSENLTDFDGNDFKLTHQDQIIKKEQQFKKFKKQDLTYKTINSFMTTKDKHSSQEQSSEQQENNKQPETVNQVRQVHNDDILQYNKQSNIQQNFQNTEVQKQETLIAREMDEKLRENSSFNIKQEIGSNQDKSYISLNPIFIVLTIIFTSFN